MQYLQLIISFKDTSHGVCALRLEGAVGWLVGWLDPSASSE
jgi:hypothetical protein